MCLFRGKTAAGAGGLIKIRAVHEDDFVPFSNAMQKGHSGRTEVTYFRVREGTMFCGEFANDMYAYPIVAHKDIPDAADEDRL